MGKSNLIVKATPEQVEEARRRRVGERICKAMNMLDLQEKVGLTYREARVYLIPCYYESDEIVAQEFGVNYDTVQSIRRRAKKKIEDSGLSREEIFGDHMPRKTQVFFEHY